MTYTGFMRLTAEKNIGLLSERYNIEIAAASVKAAKVFNDPEISFDYSNNQDWDIKMGQSYEVGLSYTIPLGGARATRIQVAKSEQEYTEAAVEEYFRQLKAEASEQYANAWLAYRMEQVMRAAYNSLRTIAHSDSIRYQNGEINSSDALQSAIEAKRAYNQWQVAEAEWENARIGLSNYVGGAEVIELEDSLAGGYDVQVGLLSADSLVSIALSQRPDVRMARLQSKVSESTIRQVRAMMAPDLTLSATYVHSTDVLNEIAPAPKYDGFSVGVSLPISFSAANKGELNAAKLAKLQSDMEYDNICKQVDTEVRQRRNSYLAAIRVLSTFDSSLINDATLLLQKRTFAYQSGESGIFELLAARSSFNELVTSYYETLVTLFLTNVNMRLALGE